MNRPQPSLLVAERNANIREFLRRELGKEGYAVATAASGTEIRDVLAGGLAVDLIILDAEIEGPEGGPILSLLLRLAPAVPVVLHVFPGLEAGEADPAVAAVVEKGGDFERLKAAVRGIFYRRPAGVSGGPGP